VPVLSSSPSSSLSSSSHSPSPSSNVSMRPARSLWAFPALRPPSSPPRAWCLATSANASSISRRRCANSSSVSAALDAICSRRAASPSVRSSGGEITAPPVNSQTLKAGWSAEFSTSRSLLPERPLREERTATAARSSDSRDCADAANTSSTGNQVSEPPALGTGRRMIY